MLKVELRGKEEKDGQKDSVQNDAVEEDPDKLNSRDWKRKTANKEELRKIGKDHVILYFFSCFLQQI